MTDIAINWTLVCFKLLAGAGAGILGFAGLSTLVDNKAEVSRKALVASLIVLVAAGLVALLQMAKPAAIMSVVSNLAPETPIFGELVSYGIAVVVCVVYVAISRSNNALTRLVAVVAVIVAVSVGFTSGYSHLAMTGTASWHIPAIPVCFLFSSLLMGGLGYLALTQKDKNKKSFKILTIVVIVLAVLTTIAYVAYGLMANLGSYVVLYWALAPGIGGVVCTVSTIGMRLKNSPVWLYTGVVSALVGAVTIRAIIWATIETGLRTGNSIIHL